MAQTIGYKSNGTNADLQGRRLWTRLSFRHFERKGLLSKDTARKALDSAEKAGYLVKRPSTRRADDRRPFPTQRSRYEYAIRWDTKTRTTGTKSVVAIVGDKERQTFVGDKDRQLQPII